MEHGLKTSRRRARPGSAIACVILALAGAALSVSQALAAASPTATTGNAQQVQFASATVTGTVNPAGATTSYHFEYGSTSDYGLQTSAASAGAGTSNVAVQQSLSGLTPKTTYHYRLVASSAAGPAFGQDETFATSATPAPAVTTRAATSVSFASASVTGSVDPEGVPTTYYFQYGTTVAYGTKTAVQSAQSGSSSLEVNAALAGLAAGTLYHYRLVATSAGGTVVGNDATFTTTKTPAPVVISAAPTNVATTSVTANATVNPGGVATTYHFQYGTTSGYGHDTATHSAGSGTTAAAFSAALSGLAPGTTYHYRVVAVSAGGTVDGHDVRFVTAKSPSPSAVTGPASAVTTTTATLAGTIDPHGAAASYYFLYGTKAPTIRTATSSAGAGTTSVGVSTALANLAPGTRYAYRLVAIGANTVTGATLHFTTATVPPVLALTAAANPVRAGASVTFNGTLTGTGAGIRTVVLQVEPYPYKSGFTTVGDAEQTSAAGAFAFTLSNLAETTRVRAVTVGGSPSLATAVTLEHVVVRVSVHVHRHGRAARFSGAIAPVGAPVQIRIQRRFRGRWITIVRTTTHPIPGGVSAYAGTIHRPHRGRYRIVAHVRDGSLLSGRSRVLTLR
jgi:phosphodiesterase/alkaline phosphatase D-like protein